MGPTFLPTARRTELGLKVDCAPFIHAPQTAGSSRTIQFPIRWKQVLPVRACLNDVVVEVNSGSSPMPIVWRGPLSRYVEQSTGPKAHVIQTNLIATRDVPIL